LKDNGIIIIALLFFFIEVLAEIQVKHEGALFQEQVRLCLKHLIEKNSEQVFS